ncbi:MAG: DUF1700 domain-containing protein [Clostridia bacterium]|nr:DUF1700 domain-containing protein [Clostridia bacterium]
MNKAEFLNDLKFKLNFLSEEEREKTLNYYNEIIEDRIESGMSEEKAVSQMESTKVISEKLKPKENIQKTTSEKILDFIDTLLTKHGYLFMLAILIFSFPIWSPIVATVLTFIAGILIFIGVVLLFIFLMIATGAICTVAGLIIGISFLTQSLLSAIAALGISMIFAGITILLTIGTIKIINGISIVFTKISNLFKNGYHSIKNSIDKRRNSK